MESFNVRPEDVKRFVSDSLVKVGATVSNAKTVADVHSTSLGWYVPLSYTHCTAILRVTYKGAVQ